MPASKNTTVRYLIINRCLTSKGKKYWSAEELIRKMEEKDIRVNTRTIRYDVEAMRFDKRLGYNAPIEYSKMEKGYYYTDANYSIGSINLSDEQLQSFDFVLNSLYEFQDLKVMHEFQGAIDKLAGIFSQLRNPRSTAYIEFEKAPYYKGIELRDELLDTIQNKKIATVSYTTFGRSYPIKHIVHPYLLKEYKNRWYLIAWLPNKKKPITLALDRIDKIAVTDQHFTAHTDFHPKEYFTHFMGITHTEGEVEEVLLHCSPSLANYIKTQHLHASQQIVKEDKAGMHIRLNLIPNYELIATILGYGKDMHVLQPDTLKQQVKQNLEECMKQYE